MNSDSAASRETRQLRILVVDDEPMVLSTIRRTLEMCGYEVVSADTGDRAVAALAARPNEIDLAIVDLTIGEHGAPPIVIALRGIMPDLRVLLISGYPLDEHSDELRRSGANGFISKPFRPEELERTIQRVLAASNR